MSPAYTVVIPTRNRPLWLEVSVRAVLTSVAHLRATHGERLEVQVLVVDDASDDDSAALVAERCEVDYLRIETHDGRRDPGAARVLGIQHAKGDYYFINDDDDAVMPHFLSAVHEKVLQDYDVIAVSFQMADDHLVPTQSPTVLPAAELGDLLAGHITVNDGAVVRRSLVADFDWDVSLEKVMLEPLWTELLLQRRRFTVVETPSWLYRRHTDNVSLTAMDDRDLANRTRSRARMNQVALERWGHVPASPIEERKAQAEREAVAARAEQERAAAEHEAQLRAAAADRAARKAARAAERQELERLRREHAALAASPAGDRPTTVRSRVARTLRRLGR